MTFLKTFQAHLASITQPTFLPPSLAAVAHIANIFICAIAAIASVLAVIRITLGA